MDYVVVGLDHKTPIGHNTQSANAKGAWAGVEKANSMSDKTHCIALHCRCFTTTLRNSKFSHAMDYAGKVKNHVGEMAGGNSREWADHRTGFPACDLPALIA